MAVVGQGVVLYAGVDEGAVVPLVGQLVVADGVDEGAVGVPDDVEVDLDDAVAAVGIGEGYEGDGVAGELVAVVGVGEVDGFDGVEEGGVGGVEDGKVEGEGGVAAVDVGEGVGGYEGGR